MSRQLMEVIIFCGKWCAHCKSQKRDFQDLGWKFTEVDVEDNVQLSDAYKVFCLPTTVLKLKGEEEVLSGWQSRESLKSAKKRLEERTSKRKDREWEE